MDKGLLSCADSQDCPHGCSICSNCLRLLGCEDDSNNSSTYAGRVGGSTAAAAAAVLTLIVGTGCCMVMGQKRGGKGGKLNDHLMDDTNEESQDKIWMVPDIDDDSLSGDAPVSTSSMSGLRYPGKEKSNTERASKRYSRFPDLLGPALATDQALPSRRILTVPTDTTSHSGESSMGDQRSGGRMQQRVTQRVHVGIGVYLMPAPLHDDGEEVSVEPNESLSEDSPWSTSESSGSASLSSYSEGVSLPQNYGVRY
jgi:hypothetical protein